MGDLPTPAHADGDEDGALGKQDARFHKQAVVVAVHLLQGVVVEPVQAAVHLGQGGYGVAVVVRVHQEAAAEACAHHRGPCVAHGTVIHIDENRGHIAAAVNLHRTEAGAESVAQAPAKEKVLTDIHTSHDVEPHGGRR